MAVLDINSEIFIVHVSTLKAAQSILSIDFFQALLLAVL